MFDLYAKGVEHFGKGDINWPSDNVKLVLVDSTDYTVDLAAHEFLSDIPIGARVATSPNITGKTVVGRVFGCDTVVFPSVSGDSSEAIVSVKDTGSAATSPLISYHAAAGGLPVTPNAGDITVQVPSGLFEL